MHTIKLIKLYSRAETEIDIVKVYEAIDQVAGLGEFQSKYDFSSCEVLDWLSEGRLIHTNKGWQLVCHHWSCLPDGKEPNWLNFLSVEIDGVAHFNDENGSYYEVVEDKHATQWTVYARGFDLLPIALHDCESRAEAEALGLWCQSRIVSCSNCLTLIPVVYENT